MHAHRGVVIRPPRKAGTLLATPRHYALGMLVCRAKARLPASGGNDSQANHCRALGALLGAGSEVFSDSRYPISIAIIPKKRGFSLNPPRFAPERPPASAHSSGGSASPLHMHYANHGIAKPYPAAATGSSRNAFAEPPWRTHGLPWLCSWAWMAPAAARIFFPAILPKPLPGLGPETHLPGDKKLRGLAFGPPLCKLS